MSMGKLLAIVVGLGGVGSAIYFTPVSRLVCHCRESSVEAAAAQEQTHADSPVICTLSPDEKKDRKNNLMAAVFDRVLETKPLKDGYAFRFAQEVTLAELVAMIEAERKCCGLLKFRLEILPDNGPIWMEVTGREGTKEMLKDALALKE